LHLLLGRQIEGTYLAANTAGMAKKPEPPPQRTRWHVSMLATKRQWVGEIGAVDEREAIEIAVWRWRAGKPSTSRMDNRPRRASGALYIIVTRKAASFEQLRRGA
jgi:hypothetical protein